MRDYDDYVGCNQDDECSDCNCPLDDDGTCWNCEADDFDDEPDIDEASEWADLPYGYDDDYVDDSRDCDFDSAYDY